MRSTKDTWKNSGRNVRNKNYKKNNENLTIA